jgi:inhibitor of KinA
MTDLTPLGDQAALAYFADEAAALRFAQAVRAENPCWLVDVVQAYASVAVFFDLDRTGYRDVAAHLRQLTAGDAAVAASGGRRHRIPCCYTMQLDLARVADHLGISADNVIALHTATEYTVYAIGFCPGFPYLGYLPAELCGVPRLEQPRLRVEVGSVGLTGRQTGIYTETRPGGWNILGRTPLELVNVAEGYFPLRVGDRVRFESIDKRQFRRLEGKRLE